MYTLNTITNKISSFDPATDLQHFCKSVEAEGEEVSNNGIILQVFTDSMGNNYTATLTEVDYFSGKDWSVIA